MRVINLPRAFHISLSWRPTCVLFARYSYTHVCFLSLFMFPANTYYRFLPRGKKGRKETSRGSVVRTYTSPLTERKRGEKKRERPPCVRERVYREMHSATMHICTTPAPLLHSIQTLWFVNGERARLQQQYIFRHVESFSGAPFFVSIASLFSFFFFYPLWCISTPSTHADTEPLFSLSFSLLSLLSLLSRPHHPKTPSQEAQEIRKPQQRSRTHTCTVF